MGGKPRVHELAKELGVSAKQVLVWLGEQGEFVKSASSTVERPVARRLREKHKARISLDSRRASVTPPASSNPGMDKKYRPRAASSPPRRSNLSPSQTASICKRFREASASGADELVIDQLYLECEAQYRVSRKMLREIVAADFRRHASAYVSNRQSREGRSAANRPRPQTDGLPQSDGVENVDSVIDLISNLADGKVDREQCQSCVQDFVAYENGGYGYLLWRFTAIRRSAYSNSSSRTVHEDLGMIAQVVAKEKQLIEHIVNSHGPVLELPSLARRVLDAEFSELTDVDDIGRSAADEQRRIRRAHEFLRLAVVLIIASPECDVRLWNILDQLRPPTRDQLVETNATLESAIERLNVFITEVETLLTADEACRAQFFRQAHTELDALLTDRYDFLRQFQAIAAGLETPRPAIDDLSFVVLPGGEQLRSFLNGLRSSGHYRGHQVDERRVTVLEEIEKHFGADRCKWHVGTASSSGFDSHYVVLTIQSANDSGEHAVAVSPLAGEHATYVVRGDRTEKSWKTVLAHSKPEAREQGAQKFLFTGADPYNGMRAKLVDALERPRQKLLTRKPSRRAGSKP